MTTTYDQLTQWQNTELKKRPVAIVRFYGKSRSKVLQFQGWEVFSPNSPTDKDAHPFHYGCKYFSIYDVRDKPRSIARKIALQTAITWSNENYGPFTWAKNALGDYVPKEINDKFPIQKPPGMLRGV